MGIIAGVLIGLIFGFLIGVYVCMESEKKYVQKGIFPYKDKIYRLTEIGF